MAAGRLGFLGSEIFIVRLAVTQNLNPELNIFCLVFSPPTGRGTLLRQHNYCCNYCCQILR